MTDLQELQKVKADMESGKRRIYTELERIMLKDISAHIHLTIIENQHLLAGGRKTVKFQK